MKGYKFLLNGYKSQSGNFIYKIGKTYIHDGEIQLYKSGFHFSKTIKDAIQYVDGDICVEIEASGKIIKDYNKYVCSEIKIVRELNIQNVLKILSKNKDWKVRYSVSRNKNTPIKILKELSKDCNWEVREEIACNLNTPINILKKLKKDKEYFVYTSAQDNLRNRK